MNKNIQKEVSKAVDIWYSMYCKKFKKAPTWDELDKKTKEFEKFFLTKHD